MTLLAALAVLFQAAAPADSEWVALGAKDGRVLVYRTAALAARDTTIRGALILIPAGGAGAEAQFRLGVDAARRAGALGTTLVVTPRLASNDAYVCHDVLAQRELNWGCQANNGWAAGGTASGDDTLTSYDVVDEIVRRLADKRTFPNLATIVVAGHSAGGQFAVRYAMANRVHDTRGVRLRYVVANPAHYPYPDGGRPVDDAEVGCRIWNVWPYGLDDRVGYAARVTTDVLRRQLVSRPVTYLLGEQDTRITGGLDTTCAAMAQGPFRLARGQLFARYLREKHDARHALVIVPGCGHDGGCMFTAAEALPVLFGSTRRWTGVPKAAGADLEAGERP